MDQIIEKFNIFMNELKQQNLKIHSITGDNEFNKIKFNELLDKNDINKYFIIASDEHINKKSNK